MASSKIDLTSSDPVATGFDPARLQRLDDHLARYVDGGRIAGWQVAIERGGQLAHHTTYGNRSVEDDVAWTDDTIVRLFSMTKPITSVAVMMLFEEGHFHLKNPIAKFIPSFASTPVFRSGTPALPVTEAQTEQIAIWHLLTHTSGLTYGFHHAHPTDAIYRQRGFEFGAPEGLDLAGVCDLYASMPLLFQPGTGWNYSVATDVLGRLVEVVSGMPLDEFFRTRIFEPLGMVDTHFRVPDDKQDRRATLHYRDPATRKATKMGTGAFGKGEVLSGGGGLHGTMADYLRFCRMLLNGGELDGVRILSPRTIRYMTQNHLPGGVDLETFGRGTFAESANDGVGFGLGFSVAIDPVHNKVPDSVGSYGWGGMASTTFWCDPVEDMAVVFLTQLVPSGTYPFLPYLHQLVTQSLTA